MKRTCGPLGDPFRPRCAGRVKERLRLLMAGFVGGEQGKHGGPTVVKGAVGPLGGGGPGGRIRTGALVGGGWGS